MPLPHRDMNRYCVIRWDEVGANLTPEQMRNLDDILNTLRRTSRRPAREYCVISNKNNDLYEEVWGMKLSEVHREQVARREEHDRRMAELVARMTASSRTAPEPEEDDEADDENFALESEPSMVYVIDDAEQIHDETLVHYDIEAHNHGRVVSREEYPDLVNAIEGEQIHDETLVSYDVETYDHAETTENHNPSDLRAAADMLQSVSYSDWIRYGSTASNPTSGFVGSFSGGIYGASR